MCARGRATGPTRPRTPREHDGAARLDGACASKAALAFPRRSPARTSGAVLDRHGSRRERQVTKVTFAWEPIPPTPGEQRRPGDEGVSYVDADRPGARWAAALPRPCSRAGCGSVAAGRRGGASGVGDGHIRGSARTDAVARVGAERIGSGDGLIDDRDVTVPDYTTPQVSFRTPRLFRARTAREFRRSRRTPRRHVDDRTFRARTERLVVGASTPTVPGVPTPEVAARLLNRAGTQMFDVPVPVSDAGAAEMELSFASLAAGEYLLELKAKADDGTAQGSGGV